WRVPRDKNVGGTVISHVGITVFVNLLRKLSSCYGNRSQLETQDCVIGRALLVAFGQRLKNIANSQPLQDFLRMSVETSVCPQRSARCHRLRGGLRYCYFWWREVGNEIIKSRHVKSAVHVQEWHKSPPQTSHNK